MKAVFYERIPLILFITILFAVVAVLNYLVRNRYLNRKDKIIGHLQRLNAKTFYDLKMEQIHDTGWSVDRADITFFDKQLIVFMKRARVILLFHDPNCKPGIIEGISRTLKFDIVRSTGNGFELVCRFEPVYRYQEVRFKFNLNEVDEGKIFNCLKEIVAFD